MTTNDEQPLPPPRAPYTPPTLVVLGAVGELTEMVGRMSMRDGGMGGMRRSQ